MNDTTTWPDRARYQESVEAPQHSFDDPELRGATFVRGTRGLMAWSGARAIVFRAVDDSGRSTAVRFLLNRDPAAGTRYDTLARHLSSNPIPAFARTDWLPDGLKIEGSRYPLLKMEWVEGVPLDRYITDCLKSPTAAQDLRATAQAWAHSCHCLGISGISHGDVHAGNTLVQTPPDGSICVRLVDYDNVWVPGLNAPCREVGNAAFQHPARPAASSGPYRDALPNTLTYLSLIAVADNPELWLHHGEADDTLLFEHSDLAEPSSQVWDGLLGSSDPAVVAVAELTIRWLRGDPDQIRSLDEVIAATAIGAKAKAGPNTWRSPAVGRRPWPPGAPPGAPKDGTQTWPPRPPSPGWQPGRGAAAGTPPAPAGPPPVVRQRSGRRINSAVLLVLLAAIVVVAVLIINMSGGQPPTP